MKCGFDRLVCLVASVALLGAASGADVSFLDTAGDHDLANKANYTDETLPTESDVIVVDESALSGTALTLSADLSVAGL